MDRNEFNKEWELRKHNKYPGYELMVLLAEYDFPLFRKILNIHNTMYIDELTINLILNERSKY